MQIVYLLLKNISELSSQLYFYFYKSLSSNENAMLNGITDFLNKSDKELDITDKIKAIIIEKLEGMVGTRLNTSFMNTFGDLSYLGGKDKERKSEINIALKQYNLGIIISDKVKFGNLNIGYKIFAKRSQIDLLLEKIGENTFLYYNDKPEKLFKSINAIVVTEMNSFLSAVREHIADVYFLPASRSGIYSGMSAFGQIIAELSKSRSVLTKKIELPGISEPISDYFISLSNISPASYETQQSDFDMIAKEIETEILKGEVLFDDTKKALIYKPLNFDIELEMSSVSSMVSEMSPIVAFLKYIMAKSNLNNMKSNSIVIIEEPGMHLHPMNHIEHIMPENSLRNTKSKPIIFIEEPEAHLHPENQIKLVELFTKLINYDVKLIMTSHSNYIFNKLNNLVMSKKLDMHKYCPIILTQTKEGSISKRMDIDELGVSDENFVDVSEALYEERENIIEQINLGVETDDNEDNE